MSKGPMRKSRHILLIMAAALAFACKPTVPSQYIQPDELEDILYDYHLADAMADENHNGEDSKYNRQLYRQAALKKYGVTQAEFDSSLIYYTRHSDRLHAIYENLVKRFSDEALALGASANEVNQYGNLTSDGDTANVWTGLKSVILTADAPYNVMTFSMTADTTYHKGDRIILSFNSDFIFKDGIRDAVAALALQLGNDSVACNTMHISSNSKYNVTVTDNDRLGIKSVRGFLYLPKDTRENAAALRVLSITNISMVRFHNNEKPATAKKDSARQAKPDSLKSDTAKLKPLSPLKSGQVRTPDARPLPPPDIPVRKLEDKPIQAKPATR